MKIRIFLFSWLLFSGCLFGSIEQAQNYYDNIKRGEVKYYPLLARELIKDELYFSAIPFIKEFMVYSGRIQGDQVNNILEAIIAHVGTKQFEVLDESILNKSTAPSIRYILAKKLFKKTKYDEALNLIKSEIPSDGPIKPYTLILKGSIESILKKYPDAKISFRLCMDAAGSRMSDANTEADKRQLEMVRDYCHVGIARTDFAAGNFEAANLGYQDISKNSLIWPEILFEEAWNSFWTKDYNRTLGKLVTYKAPLFSTYFNPEIDVLNALTYMEMCLFEDAKKTVDKFYEIYEKDIEQVNKYIEDNGANYKVYYFAAKDIQENKSQGNDLMFNLLKAVVRDPAYGELQESFNKSTKELEKIKGLSNSSFKNTLSSNLFNALTLQRDMIGSFVRAGLLTHKGKIDKAFVDMTNIKLEVLGRLKQEAYASTTDEKRERGDIKYVERTSKQYFWTFNGEFWSDELGDYVFALKSECAQ
ncbi:MAG: hypothetical protein ACHQYQ_05000 [Bacteriovoracales bacterium]